MLMIPICLRCENVQHGMVCKKYPDGIPVEIRLGQKQSKDMCNKFKRKDTGTTSQ